MTIKLITKEEHRFLLDAYLNHPGLTLQNKGYENINDVDLTETDKDTRKEISALLSKSIVGFSRFQNFKLDHKGNIKIRLQYNYDADHDGPGNKIYFIGVGYVLVDNLLNGFEEKQM